MKCKWEEKPLGELVSYMARGIAPKYSTGAGAADVLVLGQKCVRNQQVDISQARYHDSDAKQIKAEKVVQPLDILVNATGVGSAGRVAQAPEQLADTWTTDSHVLTLRASGIDPLYLGYFVKSKQKVIEGMAEGSTGQTEMNKARLCTEIVVTYPESRATQRAIASILSALDHKIALNCRINDHLAVLLEAAYDGCLAHSSRIVPLGEVIKICSGGTPRTSVDEYWRDGQIPFFAPGDVVDSVFSLSTAKHITKQGLANCNSDLYETGTVMLTARGTVGKVTMAGAPMAMNQSCFALVGLGVPQSVVFQAIKRVVRSLQAKANGATFAAINIKDLETENVIVPSSKTLDRYSNFAEALLLQILENEKESLELSQIRDVLLPKLMSGEIDVSQVDLTQLNGHLSDG
ncbi:restriction endonuclease subunit S [uncultured Adlercreutzia sp.]|uniref:restriction endonuclease subunit S n=1 Tax=uncultured Adlercreutzia sp. TaxID=875803 RepID=UPI00262F8502|nr:restriction endonuclease subunit S [uncultured Adlercreutzia sp.]